MIFRVAEVYLGVMASVALPAAWIVVALTACGRIGFEGPGGGGLDAAPPGDAGPMPEAGPSACRANPAYASVGGSVHTYRAVDGDVVWLVAKQSCEVEGAYLAIPDDAAEAALLPGDGWLGVTDAGSEGTWLTVLGDPAPYLPWESGEPDGGTSENCARFDDVARTIESRECIDTREWVCECD